ncbi:MAG: hypothetical protein SOH65_09395 [Bifidobacterium sp.]
MPEAEEEAEARGVSADGTLLAFLSDVDPDELAVGFADTFESAPVDPEHPPNPKARTQAIAAITT